ITQLGMNMTNGVMDAQAVQRANAVMNDHKAVLQTLNREVTTGPTIVSFGGVGRTSVLITYSDVMRQIQSGEVNDSAALDAALERVIMAGRLSRGRHFIHSQAQFDIVRQTLLTELQRKNAPRPSPRANEAGGRMEADTVTL
ncbi:MAG TPA: hypothetical protein VFS42_06820, partial [Burkholderiaceae bacterium]|nr:hypothetical protein [Burkholderiaceae bacterium]